MTLGFFESKDFKISNPTAMGDGCGKCRLYRKCQTPKMKPFGKGEKGIMFIGEAPGSDEDKQGKPLVGLSGKFLSTKLKKFGLDPETDIVKLNALACRPPEGHKITGIEIYACRSRVWKAIEKYKPKVIVPLGMAAIECLIGHRWYNEKSGFGTITQWRNWAIPDRDLKCWIVPSYHPAFILRTMDKVGAAEVIFERDIKKAVEHLDKPLLTWKDERDCIEILTKTTAIAKRLQMIKSGNITFDYESTGLKPYNKGQEITHLGIATSENDAFCFPMETNTPVMRELKRIFSDSNIGKIAQNLMFEDLWTREYLGTQVQGWKSCTMQSSHVLDHRKGITPLKFQAYVRTGLIDYSSSITPYLKGVDVDDYGANAINRIYDAPPQKVMEYCAIDCLVTYRLWNLQQKEFLKIGNSYDGNRKSRD